MAHERIGPGSRLSLAGAGAVTSPHCPGSPGQEGETTKDEQASDAYPVSIAVPEDGRLVCLPDEVVYDTPAVYLSDDPVVAQILEECPGAVVIRWQASQDDFDALLGIVS